MKKTVFLLLILLSFTGLGHAQTILSIDSATFTPSTDPPTSTAFLESFTIGSETYSGLAVPDSVSLTGGSAYFYLKSDPGNSTAALGSSLTQGSLNPDQIDATYSASFAGQELFYLFEISANNNGAGDGFSVQLVDDSQNLIGSAVAVPETNGTYGPWIFAQSDSLTLSSGGSSTQAPMGVAIALSDFGVSDLSSAYGFRITSTEGLDPATFGVAAIPEPSAGSLLLAAALAGFAMIRRRGRGKSVPSLSC